MLFDLEKLDREQIEQLPESKVSKLLNELEHLLNEEQWDDYVYNQYVHLKECCQDVLFGEE